MLSQSKKQQQLEERRQQILDEIKQINTLLFKTRGEKKSVLSEVEDIDQRIKAQENLIRVTNQQANLLTREINDNTTQISNLRDELTELKEDYAAMVRKSYKSKSQQSRIMFLLSSQDFLQAYKRVQYMKQYANHRKKQGESIKEKTVLLQDLNQGLIEQRKQKDKLIAENKIAKANLTKEKKNQEALIATLKKDESGFASKIQQKQKEANTIEKEINDIIRAAIAEANKKTVKAGVETKASLSGGFNLTPEAAALAKDFKNNKGRLIWPVEKGVVVNRFGKHKHPQFPNVTLNSNGVEIATSTNANARAIFNGEVLSIMQSKNTNKAVMVRHGDYITIYYNLATVAVKKGDKVSSKDNLGTIFTHPTTGKTVLKFFVTNGGTYMNPADWVYRM